ncbi:MAG: hypothetical protein DRN49_00760 [Thaumarchaeota archaeon]|nr:MAG: hypothetical protein DRN49_00760 [Nitrososphaerota archaeon]
MSVIVSEVLNRCRDRIREVRSIIRAVSSRVVRRWGRENVEEKWACGVAGDITFLVEPLYRKCMTVCRETGLKEEVCDAKCRLEATGEVTVRSDGGLKVKVLLPATREMLARVVDVAERHLGARGYTNVHTMMFLNMVEVVNPRNVGALLGEYLRRVR